MRLLLIVLLSITCSFSGWSQSQMLIRNTNVIPVSGDKAMLQGYDVLIEDGKIVSVKKYRKDRRLTKSDGVEIDGKGKYLIPGLADMHARLPEMGSNNFSLQDYLRLNAKNGVLTLRLMRGSYEQLQLRDSIQANGALKLNLYVSAPAINSAEIFKGDVTAQLSKYKNDGFDFVQYLCCLRQGQFDSLGQICQNLKFPLVGIAHETGLDFSVMRMNSLEHLSYFPRNYEKDSAKVLATLDMMQAKNVYFCPNLWWYAADLWNLTPMEQLKNVAGLSEVPADIRSKWQSDKEKEIKDARAADPAEWSVQNERNKRSFQYAKRIIVQADRKNVPLLISASEGNFIVPGYSMVDEMRLFQEAGVNPLRILKAATYNAAEFYNETNIWGSVSPGHRADLVLLDANPLVNIQNVRKVNTVILGGKVVKF